MDIWAECKDRVSPERIHNKLIRVVESQEQIATNNLVDDLEEQAVLEALLENSKPHVPHSNNRYHYLIATPFRYPPLPYGSRFGSRQERSLLYGSLSSKTAFCESAYYRFLFWQGMSIPPAAGKFVTQHTVFCIEYETTMGFRLQNAPFNEYEAALTSPTDYTATQTLGRGLRNAGITAIEYYSARDPDKGINAALFLLSAVRSSTPLFQEQWLCDTSAAQVSFYSSSSEQSVYKFQWESYLVNGVFPAPAL